MVDRPVEQKQTTLPDPEELGCAVAKAAHDRVLRKQGKPGILTGYMFIVDPDGNFIEPNPNERK